VTTRTSSTSAPAQEATAAPRRIEIIGVPLDMGAGRRGVDMGPSALRVAELAKLIARLGYDVSDHGDLDVSIPETTEPGRADLRFAEGVFAVTQRVAEVVEHTLRGGSMPLVLGGDHSISIGSIAGSSAFFAERGARIGLVWLDAHGDCNTPQTTPSGNIHGMALAVGLGLGDPRFTNLHRPGRKVDPQHVALVGVRDLDPGEKENLKQVGVHVFTMREVDELGMGTVMRRAIEIASMGTAGIHAQLDMDVLDPEEAPGTGTPIVGGVTYREAHLAMEMLADTGKVIALDVVEINPILDEHNRTAQIATELVLSALGKKIYG
jgi:arginase